MKDDINRENSEFFCKLLCKGGKRIPKDIRQTTMKKTYRYRAFNLGIQSGFPIKQFFPSDQKPDINIAFGKTPGSIPNAIIKTNLYQVSQGQFLFTVEGLANYYVSEGSSILIEPAEGSALNEIIAYLLGTAFGSFLFQRDLLPLHGSSINMNGSAAVFAGRSGFGKSTMVRAFLQRGYPFLNDDLTAVRFENDGTTRVLPGYPQQKLWNDSLEKMAVQGNGDTFERVINGLDKFSIPAMDHFYDQPLKPTHIYELNPCRESRVRIERVSGADKVDTIMQNSYFSFLPHGLDISQSFFFQCVDLAKQIVVSKLFRPETGFLIDELVDVVEQDFRRSSN